jgi:hypothetical protein
LTANACKKAFAIAQSHPRAAMVCTQAMHSSSDFDLALKFEILKISEVKKWCYNYAITASLNDM